MQRLARTWRGPASICTCGHLGDGSDSGHEDLLQKGHGACHECGCQHFVWKAYTEKFKQALIRERNQGNS